MDTARVRTTFGAKTRPHRTRIGSSSIEAVIETPRYDLTWFKVTFGRLSVKAYTKGEHVLRFEATAHNAKDLNALTLGWGWYLVTTDDRMIPPPAQHAMAERAGASVTEVPGSHATCPNQGRSPT